MKKKKRGGGDWSKQQILHYHGGCTCGLVVIECTNRLITVQFKGVDENGSYYVVKK